MSRLLASLVRLFPAAFRERFGPEIVEHVREDWTAARARGRLPALAYALAAALDLHRRRARRALETFVAIDPATAREEASCGGCRDGWIQDLRQAVRALRRTPGFTLVAVGTLGLALGANAGIFSIVDAVLLRPLPFPEPDRLVYIGGTAPGSDLPGEFDLSPEFFLQYREQSKLLEGLSPYERLHQHPAGGRPRRAGADGGLHRRRSFPRSAWRPSWAACRLAEDEDRVALLSHGLWTSWFGGDTAVIGRVLLHRRGAADGHRRDGSGVPLPAWTGSPSGSPRSSVRRTSSRAGSGCRWSGGCGPA